MNPFFDSWRFWVGGIIIPTVFLWWGERIIKNKKGMDAAPIAREEKEDVEDNTIELERTIKQLQDALSQKREELQEQGEEVEELRLFKKEKMTSEDVKKKIVRERKKEDWS